MAKSTDSQWRATPAFNARYENLVDCIAAAIKHFLKRRSVVFVLLYHVRLNAWYLMPWSQHRHLPADHEAANATTVFRGNFLQLRSIAQSFPLDMFAQEPSDDDIDVSTETPSAPDGAEKPEPDNDRDQMDEAKQKLRDLDEAAATSPDGDSATSVKDPEP